MPFKSIKSLEERSDFFSPGHGLCAGCGAAQIARIVTKVAGKDTIIVTPTGCLEVSTTTYPATSWKVPYIHVAFENAAAAASGIKVAYGALIRKKKIPKDAKVVVLGGDGGTADIGLQSLSGAFERGDRITYICYDNEAYMNTGIQRSGATPYGAWTTTSPGGQKTLKKDLMGIAIAHGVKYAATASIAYVRDAANKVDKAISMGGPSFIHWIQPCTTGWRYDPKLTVKISKLVVKTGLWPLYEYHNRVIKLTVKVPKRVPVSEYLKLQGRFRHIMNKPDELRIIQSYADELSAKFGLGPVVQ
ncbi:MAG: thiamine pyrophosphate-dependent enzyme [Candidatus Methylarchaceae archaeon HK02M2]|nr:thiamine pyrophosphate-dependent enzyme [Candidatus Methylarchaceae archaeon HK02M2]